MNPSDKTALIEAAKAARSNAYAPYSVYRVGAAAQAADGSVFVGCNVENASSGLTVCAERNAVAAMVAGGQTSLAAIAVATKDGGTPCGACRQVMEEFAVGPEMPVVTVDDEDRVEEWTLGALLPNAFTGRGLKRE
jgi:cytidine deaminase